MIIKTTKRDKFIYILLFILVIISAVSYSPNVFADAGVYGLLHSVLLICMGGLALLTNNFTKLLQNSFENKLLIPLIILVLFFILFLGLGCRITTEDILQIFIVYICVWIGHELHVSQNNMVILLFAYALVALYLAISSIGTYVGDFSMDSNMYEIDAKNQIGAIVSTAAYVMCFMSQKTQNRKLQLLSLILMGTLCVLLFIIRCRTALLAFLIAAIFTIFRVGTKKKVVIYFTIGFIVCLLFYQQIIDVLYSAFVGDRGVSNMDDLSSNRLERNIQGIDYLSNHLFVGELRNHSGIEIIHNYLLNRFVFYGIWAFPLFLCYIIFALKILKQTCIPRQFSFYDIGYFVLIIPFICSFLEPDAPFGPGTVQAFLYILFGFSLKNSQNH